MKLLKCPEALCKFLWGALLLCVLVSQGEAAELHAIIVTDTIAVNIGSSVEADFQKVDHEVMRISFHADLPYKKYLIKGHEITSKRILATIKSLDVKSDDVVFFYFSGHGYRNRSKQSDWPNLFITRENCGIDFDLISKEIEKKRARLMVVFADVCNNIVPDIFAPPLVAKSFMRTSPTSTLSQAYVSLFRNSCGKILIAGAKTGEFAWCTPKGALLTDAWIRSIAEEGALGELADWQTVLDRAALTVKEDQNPFFEIHLKQKSPL
jgi:hypothetical protein